MKVIGWLFLLTIPGTLSAQRNALLSCGPMLCHVSHREATIWLAVTEPVTGVEIRCWPSGRPGQVHTYTYDGKLGRPYNAVKLVLDHLEVNTHYVYEIRLNQQLQQIPFQLEFHTKGIWQYRGPAPDFSFTFGSCAYINDPEFDRPGEAYGRDPRIFDSIAVNASDFMIWGGDNVYTREADFTSRSGIYYRYLHDRSIPQLQRLLASRPNYAIWDDHDFGPNDDGASYELKQESLELFREFWGNPSYGEPDNSGIYTRFSWSDCDFFLLDDRFYRSDYTMIDSLPQKNYLGWHQLYWLENALLTSQASFKFIVCGSQVLNPLNDFECFRRYEKEWNHLLNFITQHRIRGILFFSGDRHFSEIIRREYSGLYPLYDITSSAFTSRPYPKFEESREATNPFRVVPSAVLDQNYMEIAVTGTKRGERLVHITCYTVDHRIAWEYEIRQQDLRWN